MSCVWPLIIAPRIVFSLFLFFTPNTTRGARTTFSFTPPRSFFSSVISLPSVTHGLFWPLLSLSISHTPWRPLLSTPQVTSSWPFPSSLTPSDHLVWSETLRYRSLIPALESISHRFFLTNGLVQQKMWPLVVPALTGVPTSWVRSFANCIPTQPVGTHHSIHLIFANFVY